MRSAIWTALLRQLKPAGCLSQLPVQRPDRHPRMRSGREQLHVTPPDADSEELSLFEKGQALCRARLLEAGQSAEPEQSLFPLREIAGRKLTDDHAVNRDLRLREMLSQERGMKWVPFENLPRAPNGFLLLRSKRIEIAPEFFDRAILIIHAPGGVSFSAVSIETKLWRSKSAKASMKSCGMSFEPDSRIRSTRRSRSDFGRDSISLSICSAVMSSPNWESRCPIRTKHRYLWR